MRYLQPTMTSGSLIRDSFQMPFWLSQAAIVNAICLQVDTVWILCWLILFSICGLRDGKSDLFEHSLSKILQFSNVSFANFESCCYFTVTYDFIPPSIAIVAVRVPVLLVSLIPQVQLMSIYKEKSWSVKLVEGHVSGDQVRSERCKGCDRTPNLIIGNNDEVNLLLYGCGGHKCKHNLIRIDLNRENKTEPLMIVASTAEAIAVGEELA